MNQNFVHFLLCFLFCVSFIHLFLPQIHCKQTNDELLSFEKLGQYSGLASCFAKIHEDFAFCNKKAEEKGKAYLSGVEEGSEWEKRVKCCGVWKLRDCWLKFAQQKCEKDQVEHVARLPYTFVKGLENSCRDYPDGSDKCRFPLWLTLTIVAVCLIIVALVSFCVYKYVQRRRQRAREEAEKLPETEKLKAAQDV